ncbi:MAG: hypothetical protein IJZ82_01515, partial [Lachnospiraceae bacterium]|nr:hypothetical protein [Lachnospiraceae bacterium]
EIRFCSPSRESAYSFDVYVKAVIQVHDPILFYQNRNIDVDAYFDNLFSLDVKKITRAYSILEYDGMDEELTQKLSSYNTLDDATGFSYRISVVDATPGEKAQQYVYQYSKQQLDAGLKINARKLTSSYTVNFEEAIMAEVVEGKITEKEAIMQIEKYKNELVESKIKNLEAMREKGFITDKEAKKLANPVLDDVGGRKRIEHFAEQDNQRRALFDQFYTEEEE